MERIRVFRFEEFVIGRNIGAGAFALVYKAHNDDLGLVAFKCLLPQCCAGRELRAFMREAVVQSRLNHSNIVKCLGLCKVPKQPGMHLPHMRWKGTAAYTWAMVLEFCEGGTVAHAIFEQMGRQQHVYSVPEALQWCTDIAEAVQYLHRQTPVIIHRDIKPENVVLTRDTRTGRWVAKLLDFGLYHEVAPDECFMLRSRTSVTSQHLTDDDVSFGRQGSGTQMFSPIPKDLQKLLAKVASTERPTSPDPSCSYARTSLPQPHLPTRENSHTMSHCRSSSSFTDGTPAAVRVMDIARRVVSRRQLQLPRPMSTTTSRSLSRYQEATASQRSLLSRAQQELEGGGSSIHGQADMSCDFSYYGLGRGKECASPADVSVKQLWLSARGGGDSHGGVSPAPLSPQSPNRPRVASPCGLQSPSRPGGGVSGLYRREPGRARSMGAPRQPTTPMLSPDPSCQFEMDLCEQDVHISVPPTSPPGNEERRCGRVGSDRIATAHTGMNCPGSPGSRGTVHSTSDHLWHFEAIEFTSLSSFSGAPHVGPGCISPAPREPQSLPQLDSPVFSARSTAGRRDLNPWQEEEKVDLERRFESDGGSRQYSAVHGGESCTSNAVDVESVTVDQQLLEALMTAGLHVDQDWQRVYTLSGKTGTPLYMAPEVFRRLPYNEMVDTFSFGVLMYEVFSRSLLAFTHVKRGPQAGSTGCAFAACVADGYRPTCPSHPDDSELGRVWTLVQRCWSEDPCNRPNMGAVLAELQDITQGRRPGAKKAKDVAMAGPASTVVDPVSEAPRCGCTIC